MGDFSIVQKIAIWILPVIFAVTLHEAAHGYIAHKLGDDTAYRLGRVSANPFKHIDPLGTIILPMLLLATTGFIFGWAKPVPVNANRLRSPKRDFTLVALAGPSANFLMAVVWMAFLKLALILNGHHVSMAVPLGYMAQAGVMINLVLMVLNLIPIPPLDGSRLIAYLLPPPWDARFDKITPFGIVILLVLITTGILTKAILPGIKFFEQLLFTVFQIA